MMSPITYNSIALAISLLFPFLTDSLDRIEGEFSWKPAFAIAAFGVIGVVTIFSTTFFDRGDSPKWRRPGINSPLNIGSSPAQIVWLNASGFTLMGIAASTKSFIGESLPGAGYLLLSLATGLWIGLALCTIFCRRRFETPTSTA
jgi:hypothetical protein